MHTKRKLNYLYKNSKKIHFNNKSKFILFSDIHRGDNSISDEFAHNQNVYYHALKYYYKNNYTYIELGDGDELWEHSKFKHIRSAHSDVFMLLREIYLNDRFIMIYGNHNRQIASKRFCEKNLYTFYDEYEEKEEILFPYINPLESIILVHEETQGEIFLTHGHQGDFINDQFRGFTRIINRYFWRLLHVIGFQNPASPAKNRHQRHKIERNFSKWIKEHQVMTIIGHTHRPKFPKKEDPSYFNTGCCIHPRNITGIEIYNGMIALIDWRIKPDIDGNLSIKRSYIKGPYPLKDYMYF